MCHPCAFVSSLSKPLELCTGQIYHAGKAVYLSAVGCEDEALYHQRQSTYSRIVLWHKVARWAGKQFECTVEFGIRRVPPNTVRLVKTQNCPAENFPYRFQDSTTIFNKGRDPQGFLSLSAHDASLGAGVCVGMVQAFLERIAENRDKGIGFRKAAINSARLFTEGADSYATALQLLSLRLRRIKPRNIETKHLVSYIASKTLYAYSCMGKKQSMQIKFSTVDPRDPIDKMFAEDGMYHLIVSWYIRKDKNIACDRRNIGHSYAVLKQGKEVLIFDPSAGLYETPHVMQCIASSMPSSNHMLLAIKVSLSVDGKTFY